MPYSVQQCVFCSRCPTWNSIYTRILALIHGVENSKQMWLSVPYSECPTPYSSMFCSRCPTWNNIYRRSRADLPRRGRENLTPVGTHRIQGKCGYMCLAPNALVEKILLHLEYIEFKANVVIRASLRMPHSV